jgi:tetratricopeptide (TPR) repeat protein
MKLTLLILAAVAAFTLSAQQSQRFAPGLEFFAGMAGDRAAFERAMAATEKLIAENPNHAEALVWHGVGTSWIGGQEAEKGNMPRAMELLQKGIAEMARAVEIAPDNIAVRIPRGSALREMSREMPPAMAQPLLEAARTDFQHTFDMQKEYLDRIPKPHPLGELLQGLGDIYSRQGKTDEAAKYYGMIPEHVPDTEYAKRATEWMKTRQPLPAAQSGCIGCHTLR